MFRCLLLVVLVAATAGGLPAADLEFDHLWIVVTRNAPERAALEKAFQFRVSVRFAEDLGNSRVEGP
jgi:hypothetical protein